MIDHNGLRCIFAENEYGTYCIPQSSAHRPAAQLVINGGVWEPETITYMREHCGDGVVFHAGTYFGDFLPGLSVAKKVIAFEPSLENFRCAKITKELNQLNNVEVLHYGLGSETRGGFVQTTDVNNVALGGTARIYPENIEGTEHIGITTIDFERSRLQEWGDISIIQLDIEGYEEQALMGAQNTIRTQLPILILEVWNDNMLQTEFFKNFIFGEMGYREEQRIHDNVVLRAK